MTSTEATRRQEFLDRLLSRVRSNRLCCNPVHMELVSHKENQKRRAAARCAK